jgi:hypothetical protein
MALWGNLDNKGAGGTVSLDYTTGVVTGTGTTFGQVGAAATGDVIRFGVKFTGTYFGEAVIVGIASTTQLSIGRTCGLTGVAIASTSFQISQLPKYTTKDIRYQHSTTAFDGYVYGVAEAGTDAAQGTSYALTHEGWVGVTTYNDNTGTLRVKTETLVAMSGISTGNTPLYDGNPKV